MDEGTFQNEKRRILGQDWKVFERMRNKIVVESARPGHAEQCPFSFSEADKACVEWGWPNNPDHQDLALKVVQVRCLPFLIALLLFPMCAPTPVPPPLSYSFDMFFLITIHFHRWRIFSAEEGTP